MLKKLLVLTVLLLMGLLAFSFSIELGGGVSSNYSLVKSDDDFYGFYLSPRFTFSSLIFGPLLELGLGHNGESPTFALAPGGEVGLKLKKFAIGIGGTYDILEKEFRTFLKSSLYVFDFMKFDAGVSLPLGSDPVFLFNVEFFYSFYL